jgi:hypothetical protein
MDINKPQVHKKVDIIQMIHQQVNLRVDWNLILPIVFVKIEHKWYLLQILRELI